MSARTGSHTVAYLISKLLVSTGFILYPFTILGPTPARSAREVVIRIVRLCRGESDECDVEDSVCCVMLSLSLSLTSTPPCGTGGPCMARGVVATFERTLIADSSSFRS